DSVRRRVEPPRPRKNVMKRQKSFPNTPCAMPPICRHISDLRRRNRRVDRTVGRDGSADRAVVEIYDTTRLSVFRPARARRLEKYRKHGVKILGEPVAPPAADSSADRL